MQEVTLSPDAGEQSGRTPRGCLDASVVRCVLMPWLRKKQSLPGPIVAQAEAWAAGCQDTVPRPDAHGSPITVRSPLA
jgi:hypothetical protein